MHDSGAGQMLESGAKVQQRVLQRSIGITGTGMHDETGRLVYHDNRLVGVDDVESDGLRLWRHFDFEHGVDDDRIINVDRVAGSASVPVDPHLARCDPCLEPAARILGQQASQCLIQAQTREFLGDAELVLTVFLHGLARGWRDCAGDDPSGFPVYCAVLAVPASRGPRRSRQNLTADSR